MNIRYPLYEGVYRILTSEDDFKNIIDEFDFSSHSHFYKFCKARFGYSPTELRKKLKSL